ncbi:MAG: THUMP-like domain-containing protein [Pirellulales bacterium]|jgi:SAM-dependent methyltransferase
MPEPAQNIQPATTEDFQWITGYQARGILAQMSKELDDKVSLSAMFQLRNEFGATRGSLLVEQHELRPRGKAKFQAAAQMFFTKIGLEQSTDEQIAEYKAKRFVESGIQKSDHVADCCCGIGGDTAALSQYANVTAVDLSERHLFFAAANCQATSKKPITTLCQTAESIDLQKFAAWHIDPDRRVDGQRTTKLENYSPALMDLEQMLQANSNAAIKLAPAASVPEAWHQQAELEWISRDRECKQLVAWFGDLTNQPGQRKATKIDRDGTPHSFTGQPIGKAKTSAEQLGQFIYEPDPAILAAELTDALAAEFELKRLMPRSVYLTADHLVESPLLSTFEVTDCLPMDVKKIRKKLLQLEIGKLEIKKRGVDILPEAFRKKLKLKSELPGQAVLILTPTRDGKRAILCQRFATGLSSG